jgi:hypothetical protein
MRSMILPASRRSSKSNRDGRKANRTGFTRVSGIHEDAKSVGIFYNPFASTRRRYMDRTADTSVFRASSENSTISCLGTTKCPNALSRPLSAEFRLSWSLANERQAASTHHDSSRNMSMSSDWSCKFAKESDSLALSYFFTT